MSEYKNLLVGVDGSEQSKMAVQKAIDIAKRNNAKLHLLSIVNGERYPNTSTVGYGFVDRDIYKKATDEMTKELAEMKKKAEAAGVSDVVTDVKIGNAKMELTEGYAKEHDVDLILVGATGLNMIGRMIVGSTAAYVIRQADCDVMVIKTDENNKKLNVKIESYPEI